MFRRGASTGDTIREHLVAAEAEAGATGATNPFVALAILRILPVQSVFSDSHPTSRAPLGPSFPHPSLKRRIVSGSRCRGVLLAGKVLVVWLRSAQQTTSEAAHFAREGRVRCIVVFQRHTHRAVGRGACEEARRGRHCLVEAFRQNTFHELGLEDVSKFILRKGGVALRAGHVDRTELQPGGRVQAHAI